MLFRLFPLNQVKPLSLFLIRLLSGEPVSMESEIVRVVSISTTEISEIKSDLQCLADRFKIKRHKTGGAMFDRHSSSWSDMLVLQL